MPYHMIDTDAQSFVAVRLLHCIIPLSAYAYVQSKTIHGEEAVKNKTLSDFAETAERKKWAKNETSDQSDDVGSWE